VFDSFDQPLKPNDIPNSVKYLVFGRNFNTPLMNGSIPDSVTHLVFGLYFEQQIKQGDVPNSVTHLTFGHYFNEPLTFLPKSVTNLYFNGDYDRSPKPIIIPYSVKHLEFGFTASPFLEKMAVSDNISEIIYYDIGRRIKLVKVENPTDVIYLDGKKFLYITDNNFDKLY